MSEVALPVHQIVDPLERAVRQLVKALLEVILSCEKDGDLIDPILRRPLPPQYQHAWAGMACHLAVELDLGLDSIRLQKARSDLWKHQFQLNPRAQSEFQATPAAALLYHPGPNRIPIALKEDLETFLESPKYLARPKNSGVSNNWIHLQGLTRWLAGKATGKTEEVAQGLKLLRYGAERHQDADGIFRDSPEQPAKKGGARPLTYHAKMTSLALLGGHLTGDPFLYTAGERGADALARLAGMTGEIGWFGRSSLALFGDVGLISSALLLPHHTLGVRTAAFEACERLLRSSLPHGVIPITPCGLWEEKGGWDGYMHLWDYETYAAGWLALCLLHHPERTSWTADRPPLGVSLLPNAGFAVVRDGRRTIGIAVEGDVEPAQAPLFCDLRSLGGQVNLWQADGRNIMGPPPMTPRADPYDLAHSGAMPFFTRDDLTWGPRQLERTSIRAFSGGVLASGEGPCIAIEPRSRWASAALRRTGFLRRTLHVRKDPTTVRWSIWATPGAWIEFWRFESARPTTWQLPIPRILVEARNLVEFSLARLTGGGDSLELSPIPVREAKAQPGSSAGPFFCANAEVTVGKGVVTFVRWAHLHAAASVVIEVKDGRANVRIGPGVWRYAP